MFYRPKKCESCGNKKYPIIDENKKLIWQNLLKIDWMSLLLIIGLILLLFGVKQINEQCFKIVENPCKYTHDAISGKDLCVNSVIGGGVDYGNYSMQTYPEENS